jgi:Recombination endonuclease VII
MLKRCPKCSEEKPFTSEFVHRDKTQPHGLCYQCKTCVNADARAYKMRPETKKKRRAYIEANREQIRARVKAYNEANKEHNHQVDKAYRDANREKRSAAERARRYGFSLEQWEALYHAQGGCCALCRVDLSSLSARAVHVDHCHTTNKVRGILCHDCNTSIGKLGDTPESIMRVYQYVTGNLKQEETCAWCEPYEPPYTRADQAADEATADYYDELSRAPWPW